MSNNEVILHASHDGHIRLRLTTSENTVWLSQADIAELFGKGRSTVAEHISTIFKEQELDPNQVCRNFRQTAEDQARHRKALTMVEWEQKLDAFLVFNERQLLEHAGKISAQVAEKLATARYTEFDQKRQQDELLAAEIEDIALLESFQTVTDYLGRDTQFPFTKTKILQPD